jgi:hypothetical protein
VDAKTELGYVGQQYNAKFSIPADAPKIVQDAILLLLYDAPTRVDIGCLLWASYARSQDHLKSLANLMDRIDSEV